mgnify:CR=1 FL=1
MKNKYKKILVVISILLVMSVILGTSYALWNAYLKSDKTNIVKASCFDVSLNEEDNITLQNVYPLTNKEGKNLTPYKVVVTNNCDSAISYQVNLEILNTSTLTNMDYVKVMFKDLEPELVSSYETTNTTITNASKAYKLENGYMDAKEKREFNIRLWIDENVTQETEGVQNKSFKSKITVKASYEEDVPSKATEYLTELAKTDDSLVYDETSDNNLRYIGSNPNNYVSVDGELWRIIGVMNDIDDGTGNKESRLKLIRNESIGSYSWDTSESSVNSGYGVNEWSQADLMKLLNPGYESEKVGGSLYWNGKAGTCYNGINNTTTNCDFTGIGIKNELKYLIDDAVWHTGSNDGTIYKYNNVIGSKFYELERSSDTGKICLSGNYCNDTVDRTTTWIGKIGLMYASDYGYATSGGSTTNRTVCLNTNIYLWDNEALSDCKNENYLLKVQCLTSYAAPNEAYQLYCLAQSGRISTHFAYLKYTVYPAVYLSSSVRIISGTGSSSDPFVLGM